jgi:hypothetical protein
MADTIPPADSVSLTLRLPPELKEELEQVKERTGRSLNTLIVEACAHSMTLPGGSALIDRERRKLTPQGDRGEQAWAAVAYLLSYLGATDDARRAWPWTQEFPGEGGLDDLVHGGGLIAAEIDHFQKGKEK